MTFFKSSLAEIVNYFCRLIISPKLLLSGLVYFFSKIWRAIERRVAAPTYYYPEEIKKQFVACLLIKQKLNWTPPYQRLLKVEATVSLNDEWELAGRTFSHFPQEEEITEQEEVMSLHRWSWLLTAVAVEQINSKTIERCLVLVEEWCDKYFVESEQLVFDSYSTGERICNGLLFYWRINQPPSDKVLKVIGESAKYLITHLEYRGAQTNNHIINNARALYFAGCFLGVQAWSNLAKIILRHELKNFITADGFLREGSSHYHFLFARWILEILWLARQKGDAAIVSFLEPFAEQLVRQCWFFLVWDNIKQTWHIPLIGDVSPDFTPAWLIGLPWSSVALSVFQLSHLPKLTSASGWHYLLNQPKTNAGPPIWQNRIYEFHGSGWYRFDFQTATLFVRIKLDESLNYPTHGHSDLGSFVLYVKGSPVFVDPGRLNYTFDKHDKYSGSALAHNTVLVNGQALFPSVGQSWFVKEYLLNRPVMKIEKSDNDCNLRLALSGGERFVKNKITFVRILRLGDGRLEIEDQFIGRDRQNWEMRLHLAPNIKSRATATKEVYNLSGDFGVGELKIPRGQINILRGEEVAKMGGWYYPQYGRKEITTTFSTLVGGNLPAKNHYQLIWK